jgi:hypothetical protein
MMEQSAGFKDAVSKVAELEQQLSLCEKMIGECENSETDAKHEINEHFAKCLSLLAARKEALLGEVAQKAVVQSTFLFKPNSSKYNFNALCTNTI